jgi:hypothetical protein
MEISCCGIDGATATVVVVAPTSVETTVVETTVVETTVVETTVVEGAPPVMAGAVVDVS